MMFAVYAGFALALIMSSALSIALRNRGAGFWEPGVAMMSMPLVAQFLLLVAHPRASWRSRRSRRRAGCSAICEPADRSAAVNGARDAMLVLVVLPTTVFALLQGLVFWTIAAAVSHAAFTLVLGRLLCRAAGVEDRQAALRLHLFPGKLAGSSRCGRSISWRSSSTPWCSRRSIARSRAGRASWCGSVSVATLAAQVVVLIRRRAVTALPGLRFDEEDSDGDLPGLSAQRRTRRRAAPAGRRVRWLARRSAERAGGPLPARSASRIREPLPGVPSSC